MGEDRKITEAFQGHNAFGFRLFVCIRLRVKLVQLDLIAVALVFVPGFTADVRCIHGDTLGVGDPQLGQAGLKAIEGIGIRGWKVRCGDRRVCYVRSGRVGLGNIKIIGADDAGGFR